MRFSSPNTPRHGFSRISLEKVRYLVCLGFCLSYGTYTFDFGVECRQVVKPMSAS